MLNQSLIFFLVAHSISSLGTALYLNVAIGVSAQTDQIAVLAGIQALILLPSVILGKWLGGLVSRGSLGRIILFSDLLGVLIMGALAISLQKWNGSLAIPLLIGAASGSVVDFTQGIAKNIQLTDGQSYENQAKIVGAFQLAQALNLVIAPLLAAHEIARLPVQAWAWINASSYLFSMAFLGICLGKAFFSNKNSHASPSIELPSTETMNVNETPSQTPLSRPEMAFFLLLSALLGACGLLIPLAGSRVGGGAQGALIAESFYALGICTSGGLGGVLSRWIGTRIIIVSFLALLSITPLLAGTLLSAGMTYLCGFFCGAIVPLIEIYLLITIRKKLNDPTQVGQWLGKFSSLARVAMFIGLLITSFIQKNINKIDF